MLGSFPPPQARWCINFFYPNPQNDMWRIMGQVFFADKRHFCSADNKFIEEDIVRFCADQGIALFDTASSVRRLQGNAADEHLQIVQPTDIQLLLRQLPLCHDICCTGQKAMLTLCDTIPIGRPPRVGEAVETDFADRHLRLWRMPSSSRAYPLSLEKKSTAYTCMFQTIGFI